MELETVNRLYLELSQIATAKTSRELFLEKVLHAARDVVRWDWSDNDADCVADIKRLSDAVNAV